MAKIHRAFLMKNPFPTENNPEAFREALVDIASATMPFGMFGPAHYPPQGVPLDELPLEYLAWFKERGFPKGKLGRLLEMTWELKSNGLGDLFRPFQQARGGSALRKKRPKTYTFEDEDEKG